MATFIFEEQRVIIRFLHLRGMKPIEIHQRLSETCNDGVMDVKNVRSWVRQFTEGWTSCENKPKGPLPCTSRSEDMIAWVEQMVMEDRRLTVRQIAANAGISVGSVDTILHDDMKLRKVSARWVPRCILYILNSTTHLHLSYFCHRKWSQRWLEWLFYCMDWYECKMNGTPSVNFQQYNKNNKGYYGSTLSGFQYPEWWHITWIRIDKCTEKQASFLYVKWRS